MTTGIFLALATMVVYFSFLARHLRHGGRRPKAALLASSAAWGTILFMFSVSAGIVSGGWPAVALWPAAIAAVHLFFFFRRRSISSKSSKNLQRGVEIISNSQLSKAARVASDARGGSQLKIANISIPFDVECQHFLFSGTTGAGKTQAFRQVMTQVRRRGESAAVPDVGGEALARFYTPSRGDIILNPADVRSSRWSPFAEIANDHDCCRIAASIIPEGEGAAVEWNAYARNLLEAALVQIWRRRGTNADLVHYLLFAPQKDLAELVGGTAAARLFAAGMEKMLGSVLAITATYIRPFASLDPSAGREGFSITKFVKSALKNKTGAWLFMSVRDDQFAFARSLIAAQVDVAISALLSSADSDGDRRRLWFFLDEFSSWGRIEGVGALLEKGRKKGGAAIFGLQAGISQLREAYGQQRAQTILANISTSLILRAGDPETAEYLSKSVGDQEIKRVVASSSDSGQSKSEQHAKQRAIMPSQIQTFENLQGILNLASIGAAGWVEIPISAAKVVTDAFVEKAISAVEPVRTIEAGTPESDDAEAEHEH